MLERERERKGERERAALSPNSRTPTDPTQLDGLPWLEPFFR